MADEFRIESRTTVVTVRHMEQGHRYTFSIWERPRRKVTVHIGPVQANARASLPIAIFEVAARSFAEREARKADLID
ncbi:hypothetical protein SAMN05519103_03983 [Rhizobiales bacterium GAS113]|jgi:hypothetical protein|nr:hypothetical protein SAMN05519103_03983 [Rhizobiales bacterium GAS113]